MRCEGYRKWKLASEFTWWFYANHLFCSRCTTAGQNLYIMVWREDDREFWRSCGADLERMSRFLQIYQFTNPLCKKIWKRGCKNQFAWYKQTFECIEGAHNGIGQIFSEDEWSHWNILQFRLAIAQLTVKWQQMVQDKKGGKKVMFDYTLGFWMTTDDQIVIVISNKSVK